MYIEGEGEVRGGGGSRLEQRERFDGNAFRGRVKKEKPVGLGRKGEATIEYLRRDDN